MKNKNLQDMKNFKEISSTFSCWNHNAVNIKLKQ